MDCRYVWLNQDGDWVRCELSQDHVESHENGIYSVVRSREETWQHYWLEQDEKISTVEIPISIIDTVTEEDSEEIVDSESSKELIANLYEQPKRASDAVGID